MIEDEEMRMMQIIGKVKDRKVKGRVKCPTCGVMNENEHLVDFITCYACGCSIGD